MSRLTVAIPVHNGGSQLEAVLQALATQTLEHELLVCDSGSSDASVSLATGFGARVLEIPVPHFNHGGTRNLLMAAASGSHVAFLTQDAEPADEQWLERLLAGFELAPDVGIAFGAYRARPSAPAAVRIELQCWFSSLAPQGAPSVERLNELERATLPAQAFIGRRGFFTSANACIARSAWERVPFREVPYAEDRVLAVDMLRAGYAKAYVPAAVVLHSHDYTAAQQVRRCFDEWRGLREVYGWREPAHPAELIRSLRGELGQARRELASAGGRERSSTLAAITLRHVARRTGALLGSRADLLPAFVRGALSLEGRAGFEPLELDPRTGEPEAIEPAQ